MLLYVLSNPSVARRADLSLFQSIRSLTVEVKNYSQAAPIVFRLCVGMLNNLRTRGMAGWCGWVYYFLQQDDAGFCSHVYVLCSKCVACVRV